MNDMYFLLIGGCKYAITFIYWLNKKSGGASVTSKKGYWRKSKLSKVIQPGQYMTLEDLCSGVPSLPDTDEEFRRQVLENSKGVDSMLSNLFKENEIDTICLHRLAVHYLMSHKLLIQKSV